MPDLIMKDSQLSVEEVIEKLKEAVPNNKFGISFFCCQSLLIVNFHNPKLILWFLNQEIAKLE